MVLFAYHHFLRLTLRLVFESHVSLKELKRHGDGFFSRQKKFTLSKSVYNMTVTIDYTRKNCKLLGFPCVIADLAYMVLLCIAQSHAMRIFLVTPVHSNSVLDQAKFAQFQICKAALNYVPTSSVGSLVSPHLLIP